jgi:type III restriction enzyme
MLTDGFLPFSLRREASSAWHASPLFRPTTYGFQLLRPHAFNVPNDRAIRPSRQPVVPARDSRKHVFRGFQKCCDPYQRQSNEEREFAVLIDSNNEAAVLRWMKPGAGHFRIEYANGQSYEPDFVVETRSQKLIVEIKAANEIRDVLLEFYNFPAEHWKHLRTTNPIESMFATVRHRMIRSKGCLSNKTALAMVFKLVEGAQKT